MVLPIIFSLVSLLLVVAIGYNIIQQYKQKLETNRKISIAKQRAIITEVEELLLFVIQMPFSKALLFILHNRTRNALIALQGLSPRNTAIKEHLANIDSQIQSLKSQGPAANDNNFRAPDNDQQALSLLQVTKKLRAVIRSEHAKGKINSQVCISENKRIEIIQLKINLENSIKKVNDATKKEQFGSATQMIEKLLKVLGTVAEKDEYLHQKELELQEIKLKLSTQLKASSDQERLLLEKETKKELYPERKKW